MFKSFSFFGLLEIHLLVIFIFLAVFFGAFVFYRLIHQRASYKEFEVFDCFLLSLLFGFITGRLIFIAINWPNFEFNISRWLNFLSFPGISVLVAIFTSGIFLKLLLARRKITDWEILDYWSRATCLGLVFYNLGLFLDGTGGGYITTSPLGLSFPNLTTKIHPTQLYSAIFYLLIFFLLAHLEKNYRTYGWYRGNRSQAKTGFITITFLTCLSLFSLFLLIFQPPSFTINNFGLDWIIFLIILFSALILLYKNSLHVNRKK